MKRPLFIAGSFVAAAALIACSSAPPDTTDTSGSGVKGSSSSSGGSSSGSTGASSSSSGSTGSSSSSSGATSSSSSSSSGSTPQDCSATADIDACYDCVYNANQAAGDKDDGYYDTCVCAASACATQCAASYCSTSANAPDPTPGDACDTCIQQKDEACGTQSDTQCNADPTCKPFLDAAAAAGCDNKPDPAGGG